MLRNGNPLNSLENTELRNCEKVIRKNIQAVIEVGQALAIIRDKKFYRDTHKTFKAYCADRWKFSDSRARQLIGGAEVAASVTSGSCQSGEDSDSGTESATPGNGRSGGVDNDAPVPPPTEKQTRVIRRLPEDQREPAWLDAVGKAGGEQPTATQLQEVVDLYLADNKPIDVDSEPVDEDDYDTGDTGQDEDIPPKPPIDYGKCPACAGAKWKEDVDHLTGVICAKCGHCYGEPAGDVDEDRINTQRQKTVKTAEALMRAFDDLQTMKAKPEHEEAIRLCKVLLGIAQNWK